MAIIAFAIAGIFTILSMFLWAYVCSLFTLSSVWLVLGALVITLLWFGLLCWRLLK